MAQDEQDKKGTLINELDSLRYTLNSGHEFQQDIPTLNEQHPTPHSAPSEQCDLFRDSDGIIHDPDLDVPILTDAYEEQESEIEPDHHESPVFPESTDCSKPSEPSSESTDLKTTIELTPDTTSDATARAPLSPVTMASQPELQTPVDIEQLSDETDSSVMELEQVLDELVAEQLPKLEQQLRQKLRHELEADIETNKETDSAPTNLDSTP